CVIGGMKRSERILSYCTVALAILATIILLALGSDWGQRWLGLIMSRDPSPYSFSADPAWGMAHPPEANISSAIKLGAQSSTTPSPASGAVSIRGVVAFRNPELSRTRFDLSRCPPCKDMNPDGLYNESQIVNTNHTLRNVFVYISSGLDHVY